MVRPINHDPLFLGRRSEKATEADRPIVTDLLDTLRAHLDECVGMAANMIGRNKRIIAVCSGPFQMVMINPEIIRTDGPYEAREGCLSLPGVRTTRRYKRITVRYQDQDFKPRTGTFEGPVAQIIQHEIDHLSGILI